MSNVTPHIRSAVYHLARHAYRRFNIANRQNVHQNSSVPVIHAEFLSFPIINIIINNHNSVHVGTKNEADNSHHTESNTSSVRNR